MDRVFSAVFTTPEQRRKLEEKTVKYKQRLQSELQKKQHVLKLVRVKEASGSLSSSLRLFVKFCASGFAKGYLFKMMFSLVFRIVKRPTQRIPMSFFLSKELARFGASVGLVVGLYRGILSFLRQQRYQRNVLKRKSEMAPNSAVVPARDEAEESESGDRYDRAVAGFLGGLGLFINVAEYRQFASKYALVRSLDLFRNRAERLQWIPKIEKLSYYLFGLINGPIVYSLLVDPSLLTPWYYEWILWIGDVTKENIHDTIHKFIQSGDAQPINPCDGLLYNQDRSRQPLPFLGSSLLSHSRLYIILDWFYGVYRASTMYGPVHLVPMLLFRTREVMNNPVAMFGYLVNNIVLSSCFLSSYQFLVKISAMPLMEVSQAFGFNGVIFPSKFFICGWLTAVSCEFERPSRVNELMIYCATHTMDVAWNWLCQKGLMRSVPYAEVLMFCVACAVTFSSEQEDIKPTYRSMLQYLLREGENGDESTAKIDRSSPSEDEEAIIV
jgi:hypothetical protein